jgi:hypothetical protein
MVKNARVVRSRLLKIQKSIPNNKIDTTITCSLISCVLLDGSTMRLSCVNYGTTEFHLLDTTPKRIDRAHQRKINKINATCSTRKAKAEERTANIFISRHGLLLGFFLPDGAI